MSRKLPPLNSLRAFEAAARHLSFTRAALELSVTQAAISHQVKALETYLGVDLFLRRPRQLLLTEEGHQLLSSVGAALDDLARITETIRLQSTTGMVKIRLAPSFAAKWLSPKLMDFWRRYPEVSLSMLYGNQPVNFAHEDIDLAVTYGRGDWPDVESFPIMSLDYFPVASPDFLADQPPITQPQDLLPYYLLHDGDHQMWRQWFSQAGLDDVTLKRGYVFEDTNILIQGALDGQGFALCSSAFVSDSLAEGRLVRVFENALVANDLAYYLCCPARQLKRPGVQEFRDWMLQQVTS